MKEMMEKIHDLLQFRATEIKLLIENDKALNDDEKILFPAKPRLHGSKEIREKWAKVELMETTYTIK
jgi:hypothetical protein